MQYNDFKELRLSRLGFGAMRLPTNEDKSIDQAALEDMVAYAIEHGVNYFDTAWPYHGGQLRGCSGQSPEQVPPG